MPTSATILIVDDNETNRFVLRAQLELMGYKVIEAQDGVEALDRLKSTQVMGVISDILMPRMDGYRLCQEIRNQAPWRDLPIIVYTGTYLAPEDEKLALRSGADRYLMKPAPLAALRAAVHDALNAPARRAPPAPPSDDQIVIREYNAVLVNKLEAKTRELEAKNAELATVNAALEASRAQAAGIIASAMDAIVTVDQHKSIVVFNAAAENLFRTTEAAMLGHSIDELLPERLRRSASGTVLPWPRTTIRDQENFAHGAIAGLRSDGTEFPVEASLSQIEVAGRRLTTVILRDITERQRAEQALRLASEQMRALALRLENVREQERTRIAREIHDVLAQELTRLKIDLVWLGKRAAKPIDEVTRTAMGSRIADALTQTDVAITTVQRIATELRPVILDSLGLPAAVEWQADDFSRRTGVDCHATTPGGEFSLDRERATALFRILQESLTNIARHAHASRVDIQLAMGEDYVALTVRDDGRGIAEKQLADPLSIGLIGMRERAQAFGGTLEIAPAGAGGTVVAVRLPLATPTLPPTQP